MTHYSPLWPEYLAITVLGTIIGSFLNVIVYRLPKGESLAFPSSHCPECNRPIRPWENIPIISFLLLRGKCAGCKIPISWRYPAIEMLTGLLFALILWKTGWSWDLLIYLYMSAVLVALSAIDMATMRLPNVLTLAGSIGAIGLTLVFRTDFWLQMVLGGLVGFGLLYLMGLIGSLLFHKETLGLGDVKLAGMIGLFLGPAHTSGMYIIGIFLGGIVGGGLIMVGGKKWGEKIPFGPYLAAGALVSLVWGENLWRWYIGLAFR